MPTQQDHRRSDESVWQGAGWPAHGLRVRDVRAAGGTGPAVTAEADTTTSATARAEVESGLADAASRLGLMPAASAVLRDPGASTVLRNRARYVVARAIRQHKHAAARTASGAEECEWSATEAR